MRIIGADFVALCNAEFDVLKQGGICFDTNGILEIAPYMQLRQKYKNVEAQFYDSCVITPSFANMHLHLEFSQNDGILHFGDFGKWLDSVIEKREALMSGDLQSAMQAGINACLKSGVGFVGAISSNGLDLEVLANAPLRVLYFNEAIGSNAQMLDVLYQNFQARFKESQSKASARFIPAVAVHSPYSVHSKLLQKVLEFAKENNAPLSVHFLESCAEKEWLMQSSGYFSAFYEKFFNAKLKSFFSVDSFLDAFSDFKGVYFTHCLEAGSKEFAKIFRMQGKIITCPKSNRLLNNKFLDINCIEQNGIPLCIGTDGKSSNDTLSLLDELRIALFAYADMPLEVLARKLLLSVTRNAFVDTSLPLGELKCGNWADFAVFKLPKVEEFLAQHLILYAKEAQQLLIQGKEVL